MGLDRGTSGARNGLVSLSKVLVSVVVLHLSQLRDVDQTQNERLAVPAFALVEQFVGSLIAIPAALRQDILEFHKSLEVTP
jgi:hypothetical protein